MMIKYTREELDEILGWGNGEVEEGGDGTKVMRGIWEVGWLYAGQIVPKPFFQSDCMNKNH